ncbi:MAG: DUF5522 domain-containing protein [Catalinimonas sp.]
MKVLGNTKMGKQGNGTRSGQQAGDHYIDEQGWFVFTEQYHRRRGYCCRSGCRHCPYGFRKEA